MFAALEKPMAYCAFSFAFVTLVWKSPLGIGWVPVVGPAILKIFTPGDNNYDQKDDEDKLAQYPRRTEDEALWHLIHLCIYGILGTAVQYGGILISKRTITRQSLIFYARLYGGFHLIIGMHYLIWSQKRNHSKLELWSYGLPEVYLGTALATLGLVYHAFCIASVNIRSADVKDICYRKAVLDTATVTTFMSFAVCSMAGIETSFQTERLLWAATTYSVPVVVALSLVLRPKR